MGPLTEELVGDLKELAVILEEDGDSHWSKWMRKSISLIEAGDYTGIEHFLTAFGGMGSFSDYCIRTTRRSNENFSTLQSASYDLAWKIKREYEQNT